MRRPWLLLMASPLLMAPTPHVPGDLPQCSHAIYQTNAVGSGANLIDGPSVDAVGVLIHSSAPEIHDALGDWAYTAADSAASWTYSGAADITVLMTATIGAFITWTPDAADDGALQMISAFKSEAAIDTDSEQTSFATSSGVTAAVPIVRSAMTVKDSIAVDTNDSIGLIFRHLSGLGYFEVEPLTVSLEIEQVSPPCRN